MLEPITITIAGDPVGKGRPRFVKKTGHAFTPAATRKYEGVLRLAAQRVMNGRDIFDGPVSVDVLARFAVPVSWSKRQRADALLGHTLPTVKPDADNLLKVLDAFNEVVWRDDKQIVEATIRKSYGDRPAIVITVSAV